MLNLDDENFDAEVIKSDKTVLVDFWAIGCAPCRHLDPILKTIAEKMTDIKFGKIEGSENMETFSTYGISAVPTMVLFRNGQQLARMSGLFSESQIMDWIKTKS